MKYFSAVAALVSLVPGIVSMTINTPTSVVQCQPQLISWSDGMGPYYLTIIPGGQASAAPLKSFDTQTGNALTWIVDIPSGTSITLALKDSTGATAYTDMVNIQPSSDSSCLSGGNSKPAGNTGSSAPQAADATSASISALSPGSGAGAPGSGTTSRVAVAASSAVSRAASTPSPVSATAQRTTSALVAPAGTPSPAGSNTSGAKARANVATLAVIGALGLLGAVVL